MVQVGDIRFLDLLYKRYANPMPLLDGMLKTCRLSSFVGEFVDLYNKEQKDKTLWELWLYRVHDKGYNEFLEAIGEREPETTTDEEAAKIVIESKKIFHNFQNSSTTAE